MKVLLDTNAFLYWARDVTRLSDIAHEILSDGSNEIFFSTVNAWEIAIKASIGKMEQVPEDLEGYLDEQLLINGFDVLPVYLRHAVGVRHLPHHHGDPFDRLLVVQAMVEDMPLLSSDPILPNYPVRILW